MLLSHTSVFQRCLPKAVSSIYKKIWSSCSSFGNGHIPLCGGRVLRDCLWAVVEQKSFVKLALLAGHHVLVAKIRSPQQMMGQPRFKTRRVYKHLEWAGTYLGVDAHDLHRQINRNDDFFELFLEVPET